ncbi:MAG: manganese efflux pump MntP family protein [Bacteroidota bacterium]|nr:manganese efflux pump MntP family protein [Bacteroidota bacterium]MDP4225723.1 manganese efflux pump MntP family protein [Bacteroidota bacterium]MDP4272903.1 manganese efflux pump MntP family protein [Bacteroidota bacterium]
MGFLSIFLIAVGLCFDSFAVSVSSGIVLNKIKFSDASKIAGSLAFFQATMPVLGWFAGYQVKDYIASFDHWIAFFLLLFLGVKMIYESLKSKDEPINFNPLDFKVLITLSIATSIDALLVGVSFAFLRINIAESAVIIGAVTFIISMVGILFGKKTGNKFGKKMEILGGLILIGIGVKILIEHLSQ